MATASDTEASRANEPVLLRSDEDAVATLTLNRPAARNGLSRDMLTAFQDELDAIAEDKAIKAVVIAANGPGFCAGHDMKELRANPSLEYFKATFSQSSRVMQSIVRLPQPVIARVHGIATAAGCQLVATCDLAIASEDAGFATPGVNIGLFCSTPMVSISRNVGRKKAMEMLLTGELVDAHTAAQIGLVNRVVPSDQLDEAVAALAATITAKSSHTIAMGKEAFYRQIELDVAGAYDYASEVMARNMLSHDAEEGIDAFLEKRPPVWEER